MLVGVVACRRVSLAIALFHRPRLLLLGQYCKAGSGKGSGYGYDSGDVRWSCVNKDGVLANRYMWMCGCVDECGAVSMLCYVRSCSCMHVPWLLVLMSVSML